WQKPHTSLYQASEDQLKRSLDLYQSGKYQDAVDAAMAAIRFDSKSADAYNNLAVSYLQLRRFNEATRAAEEALRLRPDFELAKNNLAWIQRERLKVEGGGDK